MVNEFSRGFTLYIGNMFGGKTAQMILDLKRAKIAGKKIQTFKISWDNRYEEGFITANNKEMKFPAISTPGFSELEKALDFDTEILAIDELQFWDERIIDFIKKERFNRKIIGTSLQFDYRANPFPLRSIKNKNIDSKYNVGGFMPLATKIKHFWPICTHEENGEQCNRIAHYGQRWKEDGSLSEYSDQTIKIGAAETYSPRCLRHFIRPKE